MLPAVDIPILLKSSASKELLEKITGCRVLSHNVEHGSKPGDGYMSVMYSISVELIPQGKSESDKEMRYYLLKCYPTHPARQLYLNKTNIFYNELCFYTKWAKELVNFQTKILGKNEMILPAFPPCEGGTGVNFRAADAAARTKIYDPLDNFILMPDLRKTGGFTMVESRKGLELDHVRLVTAELANMHALSWVYKNKVGMNIAERFPFLGVSSAGNNIDEEIMWGKVLSDNVSLAMSTFDHVLGTGNHLTSSTLSFLDIGTKVMKHNIYQREDAEQEYWEFHRGPPSTLVKATSNDKPWRVVCHGDVWVNNILFKHDNQGKPQRVVLVDFQQSREACPLSDLVYMIYTSTAGEIRKVHLDTVLHLYCDRFVEVCNIFNVQRLPGFSFDSLRRKFQRAKVVGYMIALFNLPIALADEEGKGVNLEDFDQNANAVIGRGSSSSLYAKRMIEVAQEMYDEGVI